MRPPELTASCWASVHGVGAPATDGTAAACGREGVEPDAGRVELAAWVHQVVQPQDAGHVDGNGGWELQLDRLGRAPAGPARLHVVALEACAEGRFGLGRGPAEVDQEPVAGHPGDAEAIGLDRLLDGRDGRRERAELGLEGTGGQVLAVLGRTLVGDIRYVRLQGGVVAGRQRHGPGQGRGGAESPLAVVPVGSCGADWTLTHAVGIGGAVPALVVAAVVGNAIMDRTIKKPITAGAIRRATRANFMDRTPC